MTTYCNAHTALSRLKTEAQACADGWKRQARDAEEASSGLRRSLGQEFCQAGPPRSVAGR